MKHLKKFEELDKTYNGAMKNMYDVEPEFTPPFEPGSEDEVVDRYSKKYPEFSEFFNEFLEVFPNKEEFDAEILKYCEEEYGQDEDTYEDEEDYDDADDDENDDKALTDEEIVDKYWHPELEVQVLTDNMQSDFPGDEIWVDFYNNLNNSNWSKKIEE